MKNIVKTLATLTAAVMMLSSAAALAEDVETSEIPVVEEIVEVIETVEEPAAEIEEVVETVEEVPAAEIEEVVETVEEPAAEIEEVIETAEEAPAAETEEVIETVEEPAAETEEVVETVEEPVRTAKIRLVCDDEVDYGATIKLVAELDGFESTEYGLQWQVNNGNGWKDIDGANASSYSFELSESNMDDTYRVLVTL